jgi:hypothetical protein
VTPGDSPAGPQSEFTPAINLKAAGTIGWSSFDEFDAGTTK